jgi:hypothetical protein
MDGIAKKEFRYIYFNVCLISGKMVIVVSPNRNDPKDLGEFLAFDSITMRDQGIEESVRIRKDQIAWIRQRSFIFFYDNKGNMLNDGAFNYAIKDEPKSMLKEW